MLALVNHISDLDRRMNGPPDPSHQGWVAIGLSAASPEQDDGH